jgi:hypothetical protein
MRPFFIAATLCCCVASCASVEEGASVVVPERKIPIESGEFALQTFSGPAREGAQLHYDGRVIELPARIWSGLDDLHFDSSLLFRHGQALYLQFGGKDGGESYKVTFCIVSESVIWRRVEQRGPDPDTGFIVPIVTDTRYHPTD